MATYNSAQDGNWNTDATWAEAGHPSANDDIVIMTHSVTYDAGDSVITWGNVTINAGGVLIFPTAADSTMEFNATGILTVNNNGELRAGTSVTPINKSNHCYIQWPQGTIVRNTFIVNNGATLNLYGDSDYYGSEKYADLDSDWTSGQTLYITGDYSSKWQTGQVFCIHKNYTYSSYTSDSSFFTIATVGSYDSGNNRTPITISEVAPGITYRALFNESQSKIIMLSRNVILRDKDSTLIASSSYAEKIKFDINQIITTEKVNIDNCLFYGWYYAMSGAYNLRCNDIVLASNNYAFQGNTYCTLSCDIVCNYVGASSCSYSIFSNNIIGNYRGIDGDPNSIIFSNVIGNYNGFRNNSNSEVLGNAISNNYALYSSSHGRFSGKFLNNKYAIYNSDALQVTGYFVNNTNNITNTASNIVKKFTYLENSKIDGAQRDSRIYTHSGDFLPLISGESNWQTPPSNNSWIFQAIPNSYCKSNLLNCLKLTYQADSAYYITAGNKTMTFKIYPIGWTTTLDESDIYLEVYYLSESSGVQKEYVSTSAGTFANNGWRDLSVSFTAGQDGIVYYNLIIKKYESGCYILIDPIIEVS
ncbi:MAG: G8 domain-containing protein [Promethearchaeota archaeon]